MDFYQWLVHSSLHYRYCVGMKLQLDISSMTYKGQTAFIKPQRYEAFLQDSQIMANSAVVSTG